MRTFHPRFSCARPKAEHTVIVSITTTYRNYSTILDMWQHFIAGFYQGLAIFDKILELIQPRLLYYTSHLFLLPILYYTIAIKHTKLLTTLFSMVFVNFIFSIAFWSSPTKGSMIHYIDAIAAKTTISIMIVTITVRRVLENQSIWWFFGCLAWMILFFYLSNLYSTIEWCCREHLITHFMGHLMATISMFFVFLR